MELNVYNRTREKGYALYKKYFTLILNKTIEVLQMSDNKDQNDYFENELGDIFINIDAAKRQAVEYQHSLKREICFLFTHGLLHLNGFDHMNKEDEKEMISYQKKILNDIVSEDDKGEDYESTTIN